MNHPNPTPIKQLLEAHLPPDKLRIFVREHTDGDGFVLIDDAFFEHFNRLSPANPVSQSDRHRYTSAESFDLFFELRFLAWYGLFFLLTFIAPLPLVLLGYRWPVVATVTTGLLGMAAWYRPLLKMKRKNEPIAEAYRRGELHISAEQLLDDEADRATHELRQFFIQNGRSLSLGSSGEPSFVDEAPLLYVEDETALSVRAVHTLGRRGAEAGRGYLVCPGPLAQEVIIALDEMRNRGEFVVHLSAQVIRSALADDSAEGVLEELEQQALQEDNNLFLVRTALIDRRFFYGRSTLQRDLQQALLRGEHVLLTGLRKVGKSSLLRILRQELSEHPVCHIDLQEFSPNNPDWPRRFFATLLGCVDSWGRATFAEAWSPTQHAPDDATALAMALTERRALQRSLGRERRLIIILDEIERMLPRAGQERWASGYIEVSGALRALSEVRGQRWISIIAADLRPTVNRANLLPSGDTNPLFQFFHERALPMLSRGEVEELLIGISRPMGVTDIAPAFVEGVWAQAGGHPFLTRQIAGHAYARRASREGLLESDLKAGLDAMDLGYQLGGFIEASIWGQLTEQEREVVSAAVLRRPLPRHRAALAFLRTHGLLDGERVTLGAVAEWVADLLGAEFTLERELSEQPPAHTGRE